jgi:hypothetical protein
VMSALVNNCTYMWVAGPNGRNAPTQQRKKNIVADRAPVSANRTTSTPPEAILVGLASVAMPDLLFR